MFIQIFTKTVQCDKDKFYLIHSHYLDCNLLERKQLVWTARNKLDADICNLGFAMKENIEQGRKIGIVHRDFNFISVYKGMKSDGLKHWTECAGGVRRNVTVYTENEQLANDSKSGFIVADSLTTRLFNRTVKLKNDFGIGVAFMLEKEINERLKAHWKTQYKLD